MNHPGVNHAPLANLAISPVPGELQAVRADGDDGGFVFLHHAHRLPDQHDGVGAGRVRVQRLRKARHAAVFDLHGLRQLLHASPVSVLTMMITTERTNIVTRQKSVD